jgi:hypothetical protein
MDFALANISLLHYLNRNIELHKCIFRIVLVVGTSVVTVSLQAYIEAESKEDC